MDKTKTYFQMNKKTQNKGEIYIYGDIVSSKWEETDVTAVDFKNELNQLGDVSEIDVHINSAGGNVFEGHAIYNMLKMHKARVNIYVDALAASIASVIAMSGDTIFMHKNSFMMIHNSWIMTLGNSKDLRQTADLLDKTDQSSNNAYLDKATNLSEAELKQLLEAETWLTADEALEKGLADEILGASEIAASISKDSYQMFKHVPENIEKDVDKITNVSDVQDNKTKETMSQKEKEARQQIIDECNTLQTIMNF
ncbi:Clp protease ClpP [Staphylococcus equorum]|uniref:ATP-dependent Clp protease proteolytic subunit n=1 Tax=Staphylococcus equorum TaxID=246432 RepID=A0A9X4L259_9STAP|nr:head maturation protease, ClpP-related [Staphylococcus equorum]MDG0818997.1 Clp protease ClpP [Staphylococcus equorum]MDG0839638.1 Clp protease ClpP [Staphylococcus equorum]MDG0844636.1 Clp protease ClpP [Staphylococcus equorum]